MLVAEKVLLLLVISLTVKSASLLQFIANTVRQNLHFKHDHLLSKLGKYVFLVCYVISIAFLE